MANSPSEMTPSLRSKIKSTINSFFSTFGLEIRRKYGINDFKDYIDFEKTIAGAAAESLSVSDYIDSKHNVPGATQDTIDQMSNLGVFKYQIKSICEIGPGSGRYLEKVIEKCDTVKCEIYETAVPWRRWLEQRFELVAHVPDGRSLGQTRSDSIDLVQAHKVFPGLPALTIISYFDAMARVVRNDGKVVFDILTEDCLVETYLKKWFSPYTEYLDSMMSKSYAIEFFRNRGFTYDGSFFIAMKPAITHYFVFTKNS